MPVQCDRGGLEPSMRGLGVDFSFFEQPLLFELEPSMRGLSLDCPASQPSLLDVGGMDSNFQCEVRVGIMALVINHTGLGQFPNQIPQVHLG